MAQLPPPDKGCVALADTEAPKWSTRTVKVTGVLYGGVWFWSPDLAPFEGLQVEVSPLGAFALHVRRPGHHEAIDEIYADPMVFEDAEAVDEFLTKQGGLYGR